MNVPERFGRWFAEALGADYTQWRVLTSVMLKTDFRSPSVMRMGSPQESTSSATVWLPVLMYGLFGLYTALVAFVLRDLFLAGVWALSMVGLTVAMAILVEYRSVVISPDDYEILAHQPVSSRTYFIVKLTNLLVYAGGIGVLVGGPTCIALAINHDPTAVLAWPPVLVAASAWTALLMVFVYVGLLRVVRPERLGRILSYVQLLLGTLVMAAPLLVPELADRLEMLEIEPSPAMFILPAAWFASVLTLAAGEWSTPGALAAFTAGVSTAGLLYAVGRRLSLSYAERLGALLSTADSRRSRSREGRSPGRAARGGRLPAEMRAVATLLRGNFRYDLNFRLGVLSILPMTLLYLYLSLRDGPLPDPFVDLGFGAGGLWLLHLLAVAGPQWLLESLFRSPSFRAAWIFFTAPVDLARLVVHTGHCIAVFALLPYVVVLGGIFAWAFGDVPHAVAHAAVIGLISNLAIQARLMFSPRLPFSEPFVKGGFNANVLLGMVGFGLLVGLLPLPLRFAYASTGATIATFLLLAVANASLPLIAARRIGPRLRRLEFTG